MKSNADIAKALVAGKKGGSTPVDAGDGAPVADESPDGLEVAMKSAFEAGARKDYKAAANAFRDAHDICAGQSETSSSEY